LGRKNLSFTRMLVLRPTKVLAHRIALPVPATVPEVSDAVADWCVHGIQIRGTRVLAFFQTATLYPLLAWGRGVTSEGALIRRFAETAELALRGTEFEFILDGRLRPHMASVEWGPIPSRSVLGSMNDLLFAARVHFVNGDGTPEEVAEKLRETPLTILNMNSPREALTALTRRPRLAPRP
jgi:hypothetical protein